MRAGRQGAVRKFGLAGWARGFCGASGRRCRCGRLDPAIAASIGLAHHITVVTFQQAVCWPDSPRTAPSGCATAFPPPRALAAWATPRVCPDAPTGRTRGCPARFRAVGGCAAAAAVADGLKYAKDHEWVKVEGSTATVGITDFAQVRCTGSIRPRRRPRNHPPNPPPQRAPVSGCQAWLSCRWFRWKPCALI